jgi:hypothetical protein
VEILLDGTLAGDEGAVEAYLQALLRAFPEDMAGRIRWFDAPLREGFIGLIDALIDRGVTPAARTAERAALRVTRALASRPRLRLTDEGAAIVREWTALTEPIVAAAADELIVELRRGLSLAPR